MHPNPVAPTSPAAPPLLHLQPEALPESRAATRLRWQRDDVGDEDGEGDDVDDDVCQTYFCCSASDL